jgi:hypothetical protein
MGRGVVLPADPFVPQMFPTVAGTHTARLERAGKGF